MSEHISVEVTYALPKKQTLLAFTVKPNTSIAEAIQQSGILQLHPEVDLSQNKVGIWYKTVKLDTIVKEGDRIEIYRPLIADPKEVRKMRAQKAKEEGRANKVTGGKAKPSTLAKDDAIEEVQNPVKEQEEKKN